MPQENREQVIEHALQEHDWGALQGLLRGGGISVTGMLQHYRRVNDVDAMKEVITLFAGEGEDDLDRVRLAVAHCGDGQLWNHFKSTFGAYENDDVSRMFSAALAANNQALLSHLMQYEHCGEQDFIEDFVAEGIFSRRQSNELVAVVQSARWVGEQHLQHLQQQLQQVNEEKQALENELQRQKDENDWLRQELQTSQVNFHAERQKNERFVSQDVIPGEQGGEQQLSPLSGCASIFHRCFRTLVGHRETPQQHDSGYHVSAQVGRWR